MLSCMFSAGETLRKRLSISVLLAPVLSCSSPATGAGIVSTAICPLAQSESPDNNRKIICRLRYVRTYAKYRAKIRKKNDIHKSTPDFSDFLLCTFCKCIVQQQMPVLVDYTGLCLCLLRVHAPGCPTIRSGSPVGRVLLSCRTRNGLPETCPLPAGEGAGGLQLELTVLPVRAGRRSCLRAG